ncbi:MAG: hypothetical protein OXR66_02400 [Candidatus Woesearchaeota archaeon]|nr:hypothetical protein [Candidatus Woesearchaeota archaeon]
MSERANQPIPEWALAAVGPGGVFFPKEFFLAQHGLAPNDGKLALGETYVFVNPQGRGRTNVVLCEGVWESTAKGSGLKARVTVYKGRGGQFTRGVAHYGSDQCLTNYCESGTSIFHRVRE